MNNSTVNIKPIQLEKQYAIDALKDADFGESWFVTANRALALQAAVQQNTSQQCEYIEIALAEQQENEYITAEEARALGVGNAEYQYSKNNARWSNWIACFGVYEESDDSWKVRYRAIKQAQPETIIKHFGTIHEENGKLMFTDFSVDGCGTTDDSQTATAKAVIKRIEASLKQSQPEPIDPHADNFAEESHAALRVEYAKQVAEGTTGFYLWEFMTTTNLGVWQQKTTGDEPHWTATTQYRCKDISCYVSKDGEPAIRMLRTEARALQAELGDTVEWRINLCSWCETTPLSFTHEGIYAYRTKATIKLDGKMLTPEQAAAEWEAKKETHVRYFFDYCFGSSGLCPAEDASWYVACVYELRPKAIKQIKWNDIPQFVKVCHKATNRLFTFLGVDTFGYLAVFRRDCDDYSFNPPALELAPANEQDWIYWGGGECPVPDGVIVEFTHRNGYRNIQHNQQLGTTLNWKHYIYASGDIIAYRITGIAEGYKMEGSV